jgi:hypothetical protein
MIEFTSSKYWFAKNFTIVKNGNKHYKWGVECPNRNDLINSGNYLIRIIHNFEKKAMIDFEDRITEECAYRCEITPVSYKGNEWVVDTQV